MLHYIKVSNFMGIKEEVTLNFEVKKNLSDVSSPFQVTMPDGKKLLKMIYIYGANASGKTTILKAIQLLIDLWKKPLSEKNNNIEYEPFLFQENPYEINTIIELSFYINNTSRYLYKIEFDREQIVLELLKKMESKKPTLIFKRETDSETNYSKVIFGDSIQIQNIDILSIQTNLIPNNTVFGAFQKINVNIPILNDFSQWIEIFLNNLIHPQTNLTEWAKTNIEKENKKYEKIQYLQKMLNKADNQISNIKINKKYVNYSDDGSTILKEALHSSLIKNVSKIDARIELTLSEVNIFHTFADNKTYLLPLELESFGTIRFFGLTMVMYELIHSNSIFMIDELDTSLHPDLFKLFIEIFLTNSKNSQLIFTTHNQALLEDSELLRKDAFWMTDKKENGSIDLYSAADFGTDILRKEYNVAKAYKNGKLGGIPNLGSPLLSD